MQTIFPILRYADARLAIKSLCETFGFVELFSVPESGQMVRHAQLKLGSNVIMLGSDRPDEAMASPRVIGASTQALYVHVEDLEPHFERARSSGADITSPIKVTDFGSREYHARDLEGHPWTFGTYLPDAGRGNQMIDVLLKRFDSPDETRRFEKGTLELVRLGPLTIGRATYMPGWKWSVHVGPTVNASRCVVEHVGMVLSGTAKVVFDDGRLFELQEGSLFHVPAAPHDSWVVGTRQYVSLHFLGADKYAR